MTAGLPQVLRGLLRLTRHADDPAPLCRDCLHHQIREELASLSRAADIERMAKAHAAKKGAPF